MTVAETELSTALAARGGGHPTIPAPRDLPKPVYAFDLESVTYEHQHPTVTGADVMAAGNIPVSEGIIRVLPDGAREAIGPDTVIELATGAQFKRRPRFKRG
jgi:hypothetical protein